MEIKVDTEITIDCPGYEDIKLSKEEAKELYEKLGKALSVEKEIQYVPYSIPQIPYVPYRYLWSVTYMSGANSNNPHAAGNYISELSKSGGNIDTSPGGGCVEK